MPLGLLLRDPSSRASSACAEPGTLLGLGDKRRLRVGLSPREARCSGERGPFRPLTKGDKGCDSHAAGAAEAQRGPEGGSEGARLRAGSQPEPCPPPLTAWFLEVGRTPPRPQVSCQASDTGLDARASDVRAHTGSDSCGAGIWPLLDTPTHASQTGSRRSEAGGSRQQVPQRRRERFLSSACLLFDRCQARRG